MHMACSVIDALLSSAQLHPPTTTIEGALYHTIQNASFAAGDSWCLKDSLCLCRPPWHLHVENVQPIAPRLDETVSFPTADRQHIRWQPVSGFLVLLVCSSSVVSQGS